jgi:hypothetical protein
VILILQIVVLGCAVALLRDNRTVFWWCYAPTMGISGLVDAYPARVRALFAKVFFSGTTTIFVMWTLMLIFGWCRWEERRYEVGRIKGSLAACSLTTTFTVLLFFVRHVICAYLHQDRFVVIRSHVRTYRAELSMKFDGSDSEPTLQAAGPSRRSVQYSGSVQLGKQSPRDDKKGYGTNSIDGCDSLGVPTEKEKRPRSLSSSKKV